MTFFSDVNLNKTSSDPVLMGNPALFNAPNTTHAEIFERSLSRPQALGLSFNENLSNVSTTLGSDMTDLNTQLTSNTSRDPDLMGIAAAYDTPWTPHAQILETTPRPPTTNPHVTRRSDEHL